MPDSEMFKVILQGGSFGLLAIITVWSLFWGGPMMKTAFEKSNSEHTAAVKIITDSCREDACEFRTWMSEEMKRRDETILRLAQGVEKLAERR